MLTVFGKFSRKLRIDHGELIKDMANKLGVTSAYVSAVEVGKRKIPEEWLNMMKQFYNMTQEEENEMHRAYDQSVSQVKIDLTDASPDYRETAMVFARELKNLDENDVKDILEKIKKKRR